MPMSYDALDRELKRYEDLRAKARKRVSYCRRRLKVVGANAKRARWRMEIAKAEAEVERSKKKLFASWA